MDCELPPPSWITAISALGAPIVAIIAAAFGGMIAWRQWQTARNRLKLDLFERRLPVYSATRHFLACIMTQGHYTGEQLMEFASAASTAKWVFDQSIATHLEEHVFRPAINLDSLQRELDATPPREDRAANVARQRDLKQALNNELSHLDEVFSPFLSLRH